MKKSKLEELLKLITKKVIKEYSVMPSSPSSSTPSVSTGNSTGTDTSTNMDTTLSLNQQAVEKRKKSAQLQHDLKATADAQKSAKKEADMYGQKAKEYERFKKQDFKNKVDTIKNQIDILR